MSSELQYPAEKNSYLADHIHLLRNSLRVLTRRDLVENDCSPEEAARQIFHAPFALLSHNAAADPVLTYGNRTAAMSNNFKQIKAVFWIFPDLWW